MKEENKSTMVENKSDLFKYDSVKRISKIPVVETSYQYISSLYSRVKNSNSVIRWSLGSVEGGIYMVVDKTLPTVFLFDAPLTIVDSIICKGLDTVEQRVPAISYPPELLVNMSKDYVSSKLIQPVLKRADSVKQLSLTEATRVGEMAATRLDTALDIADKYVEKYLPDSTDTTDGNIKKEDNKNESKTTHAINHMNRLSKKLQRRITKRTLMEAQALKKGSVDTVECLLYLADLLVRDPKEFASQMGQVWRKLSEDEPENQVPPANLEQVVSLLMRESARKTVHTVNFLVSTLPAQTAHAFRFTLHHLEMYLDYVIKKVHLEGAKGIAIATSRERLTQLRGLVLRLLEEISSRLKIGKKVEIKIVESAVSSPSSSNLNKTEPQNQPPSIPKPESQPEQPSEVESTVHSDPKFSSPSNQGEGDDSLLVNGIASPMSVSSSDTSSYLSEMAQSPS